MKRENSSTNIVSVSLMDWSVLKKLTLHIAGLMPQNLERRVLHWSTCMSIDSRAKMIDRSFGK